jgi:enoyl-CoA hydratase/carnithine racemase
MSILQNQWKTLSTSLTDAILTISMNRPKANGLSPELLDELIQAFDQASNDKKIKGVLLRSNLKYLTFH